MSRVAGRERARAGTSGPMAVKALILRAGRVLVLRRATTDPLDAGRWDLPGGRLRPGEETVAGLRREVLEETGLRVLEATPVAVWETACPGDLPIAGLTASTWVDGDRVTLSAEHTEFRWIDRLEATRLDMHPGLRADILRYADRDRV